LLTQVFDFIIQKWRPLVIFRY